MPADPVSISRRQLLVAIGNAGGGALMYQAMNSLGHAAESTYRAPPELGAAPAGTTVLVLGAGIAGLVSAFELRKAGYRVSVLEYNAKAGGRAWTLRGGDEYTELGGNSQRCEFDADLYLNPGPWRIPYHHHAMLDYHRRLRVAVEPFVQVNYNAYLHGREAYGGRPQRFRHVQADYQGHVAELLAKAVHAGQLDAAVGREDLEILLASLQDWGALDAQYRYRLGLESSQRRGYDVDNGGGLAPAAEFSQPLAFGELLRSRLWAGIAQGQRYEITPSLFQPVGGMDMLPQALSRELGPLIRYDARVFAIEQDARGVTVRYTDKSRRQALAATADWCLCTLPLSILNQLDVQAGADMKQAIDAVPYWAAFKAGLQFKRRFWEEDDRIYGGITYTDLDIGTIGYPQHGVNGGGKGVLLGAYPFGPDAYRFTAMTPAERLERVLQSGAAIHPQYLREFENGITVGWHRVPWSLGCFGRWTDQTRAAHYENLCRIDGRLLLAGEHASRIPAWQEGAALSALDAVERLHRRVMAG